MREYRFSDDGIRTLRIRFIGIVVVLALVVVAVGVAATGLRRSTTTADLATFAIALTVVISVMAVTVWLTLGRQVGRWRAFRIRLDADGIESDAGRRHRERRRPRSTREDRPSRARVRPGISGWPSAEGRAGPARDLGARCRPMIPA